jgi:hypothetical protein
MRRREFSLSERLSLWEEKANILPPSSIDPQAWRSLPEALEEGIEVRCPGVDSKLKITPEKPNLSPESWLA